MLSGWDIPVRPACFGLEFPALPFKLRGGPVAGASGGARGMKVHEFKDPSRLTRTAVISLWVYMGLQTLSGIGSAYFYSVPIESMAESEILTVAAVGVAGIVAMIACFIIVGCWIYRASANAHSLSEDMTISPGWSVGWYFIPIANLFKPFQAMKETWMASHYSRDWQSEPAPTLMVAWWGLWIVTNILGNVAFRMSMNEGAEQAPGLLSFIEVAAAILNIPLCLILITMMKRIAGAQLETSRAEAFA